MAENIDGTTGETGPYNTKIPSLAENANIQDALRLYHYGTTTPPTIGNVIANSVAGHLKAMSSRVLFLENQSIGSVFGPIPNNGIPTGYQIPNGYIWVDQDSSAPVFNNSGVSALSVARYQNAQPTGEIAQGSVWVDKDSDPLTMYVYDSVVGWREIGGDVS
jgi:hypothetical protein